MAFGLSLLSMMLTVSFHFFLNKGTLSCWNSLLFLVFWLFSSCKDVEFLSNAFPTSVKVIRCFYPSFWWCGVLHWLVFLLVSFYVLASSILSGIQFQIFDYASFFHSLRCSLCVLPFQFSSWHPPCLITLVYSVLSSTSWLSFLSLVLSPFELAVHIC